MADRTAENLVGNLFKGIRWTGIAAGVQFLLGLVQTYVLVRLLDKADFAAMALIQVFGGLFLQAQYAVFQSAVIQQKHISAGQLRRLLQLSMWAAAGVFLLFWLIGIYLGYQYGEGAMANLAAVFGAGLGIYTIGGVHRAWLYREFRYKTLFINELIGFSLYFIVTVVLARLHFGPFSLAFGFAAKLVVESLFHRLKNQYWRDAPPAPIRELKHFFQFGRAHLAERMVTQLVFSLDYLLIGRWLGLDALGVYDVFKRALVRPAALATEALERAVFPVYSRLQGHPWRLRTMYLALLNGIATVHLPVYTALFFLSPWITTWYFGADWTEYAGVFRALSLFVVFHAMLNPVDHFLLSQGKINRWTVTSLGYGLLTAGLIWFLQDKDLVAVSYGIAGSHALLLCFSWIGLLHPLLRAGFGEFVNSVAVPALISLGAAAGLFILPPDLIIAGVSVYLGLFGYLTHRFNRSFFRLVKKLF